MHVSLLRALALALALALPLAAAAETCAPTDTYSTFCCHGTLLGPSVSAAASSSANATAAATGGLSNTLSGLASSVTAHVPIPVHTTDDTPPRLLARTHPAPADKISKLPKIPKHSSSDHVLATGVTCRGTVETQGAKNATATQETSSAAAATTGGIAATGAPTTTAASSASSAGVSSGSSAGLAPTARSGDGMLRAGIGAVVGVGVGMVML